MTRFSSFPACLSLAVVVSMALVTGCGGNQHPPRSPAPSPAPSVPAAARGVTPSQPDPVHLYRQMGLLAEDGDTPFVGSVAFLANRSADSTLFLLTVSVPSRALTFVKENDRYRA